MKHALILISLTTTISLSSCEKNTTVEPIEPKTSAGARAASAAGDLPALTIPHRLIKHGNRTLSYDEKNRLVNVSDGISTVEYSYPSGGCTVKTSRNGLMVDEVRYHLNVSGRATTFETRKLIGFKTVNKQQQPVYSEQKYTAAYKPETGQLGLISSATYDSFEKYAFTYGENQTLSQIKYYNPSGKLVQTITFNYYASDNDLRLNPDINESYMEPYLNVFGSFSKQLLYSRKVAVNNVLTTNEYYKYKYDSKGFIANRDRYNGLTNAYLDTVPFEFVTIPPVLSPLGQ
ncbi:hypothetical protein [Spirosoma sp.]|uniref:hypothetical protein n=1 Tax=Spirosoma sp. TaxID=1899569 RepID=UPI003B3A5A5E